MEEIIDEIENKFKIYHDNDYILNEIKTLFNENLKDKKYEEIKKHCGSEGFFIEKMLNIQPNCSNDADYKGYEIKKKSKKITFGDWTASGYLYHQDKFMRDYNDIKIDIQRDDYMKYFGNYNTKKKRFSWSGKCIPKYNKWNNNGTIMTSDKNENVYIIYSNEKDTRNVFMPQIFKNKKSIILQYWNNENLKSKLENKFNKKGFVMFEKNKDNYYKKMLIGEPINFINFMDMLKNNVVYFDSGMYQGNNRNYSQFRANQNIWNELVIEEYC